MATTTKTVKKNKKLQSAKKLEKKTTLTTFQALGNRLPIK
jgi:hypothetical protein